MLAAEMCIVCGKRKGSISLSEVCFSSSVDVWMGACVLAWGGGEVHCSRREHGSSSVGRSLCAQNDNSNLLSQLHCRRLLEKGGASTVVV